jgi:hypothetical protein
VLKKTYLNDKMKLEDLKMGIKTYLRDKMLLKYASAENGLKTSKSSLYYLKSYIFGNNIFGVSSSSKPAKTFILKPSTTLELLFFLILLSVKIFKNGQGQKI